jgi:hypothetical protein
MLHEAEAQLAETWRMLRQKRTLRTGNELLKRSWMAGQAAAGTAPRAAIAGTACAVTASSLPYRLHPLILL